jgi:CRISPR-associated protein Csb2
VLSGAEFWSPVPAGQARTWVTATPAIPESRPLRGRPWTIGDAALLSVGLVLRDRSQAASHGMRLSSRAWPRVVALSSRRTS